MAVCAQCRSVAIDTDTEDGWIDLLEHVADEHPRQIADIVDGTHIRVECSECEDTFTGKLRVSFGPDGGYYAEAYCPSCTADGESPFRSIVSQWVPTADVYDAIEDDGPTTASTSVPWLTEAVTPRSIVETYYDWGDGETYTQYTVRTTGTSLESSEYMDKRVIGYAEVPKGDQMPHNIEDFEEFAAEVEDRALYVHWK